MTRVRSAVVALTVAALAAGLLAAPALAKKTTYLGPILGPPAQDPGSSVTFKLVSKPRNGHLRPVAIKKLFFEFLNVECNSASGPEPTRFNSIRGGPKVDLKKGAFAYTDTTSFPDFTVETRGRIPRKGPATGTFHVTGSYVLPTIGTVTCDSTVPWEASVYKSPY